MDSCPKNHEKFVDFEKCNCIIDNLHSKLDSTSDDEYKVRNDTEKLVEEFKKVIDAYQEQPELLDPYLDQLIIRLTSGLSDSNISSDRFHTIFKFLYQLTKVVGFKSIGKKFPHETDKLPLIVQLLSKEDPQDKVNWETRYVLTIWLSIVILTPFDLEKFDSGHQEQGTTEQIYSLLTRNIGLYDSCQHVTSFCLAKFLSRPDLLKSNEYVDKFIGVALEELANVKIGPATSMDDVPLIGHLKTLAYMFKIISREEMKKRCKTILDSLVKLDVDKINRELVNHLIVKLIQRSGLALLPKRVATWRYKRGTRILGTIPDDPTSKDSFKPEAIQPVSATVETVSHEEELASAEYLESILSVLFVAAQNSQTRIRWSAAKGIARLASRLSRERASDVIDMLMANFFGANSSEFAWHGGTLTLAEMARNGLILEEKLAEITSSVGSAILYDKIKGSFAVGSHVREGACYVFWAMARVYEDRLLAPYIPSISVNLLCTMLFDRELQCRRAASATFQELVGRQGTSNEEGINILTSVSYTSVGKPQSTYLELASQVAGYGDQYCKPFVCHLLERKLAHWDVQIRRLASDSLSALMLHSNHEFVRAKIFPRLFEMVEQGVDNNARHGAILGLAKVIRGLAPLDFQFDQELVNFVGNIVAKCEKQLKSKQQAPNFIEAVGHVISSAEVANFHFGSESNVVESWDSIALTALDSDNADLREIGATALATLYRTYYKDNKTRQDRLLAILNKSLSSSNESSRCGGLVALAKLGHSLGATSATGIVTDADTPDIILMSLTSYIAKETREKDLEGLVFAQAKAEACASFVNFIRLLDKSRLVVSANLVRAGFDALLAKSEDYTFDKRGDIGVKVRKASIQALTELTLYLVAIGIGRSILDEDRLVSLFARTLQQAVSYNNAAREIATTSFYKLLMSQDLPKIVHREEMLALCDRFGVDDQFNWRDDSTPIFVNLLDKDEFALDLWTGLLPSVGQASDLCAKQFRDALTDYILTLSEWPDKRERVFCTFLKSLERADMADRLLTSGLIAADYLLTAGLMNESSEEFQLRLTEICWNSRTLGDPKRLISVARVLGSLLQFGPVQRHCLGYSLALLASRYGQVRAYVAEQLYQAILTYQPELEVNGAKEPLDLEAAMELLSQTNWHEPLDKLKPVQDLLSQHLGLPEPLPKLAPL